MARKRDPVRDKAKKLWLESGKQLPLKDIATKLGKPPGQIRKWKSLDDWDSNEVKEAVKQEHIKRNVTNDKKERSFSSTENSTDDLNPQQEMFAQLVAGQRIPMYRAYLIAYKDNKPSLTTAMSHGPRLAKEEKVAVRISQISKESAAKHEWSLDKVVESLTFLHDEAKADLIQNGLRKANADALLESGQELSKLLGFDKQSIHEDISINITDWGGDND